MICLSMDTIYDLNWIYLVICLATNTIDDLVLYLRSEEEHAFDFENKDFNENIFHDSKINF